MRARITPILAVFFVVAALLPSAAVAQHGMPPGNETSVLLPPDIQDMPRGRVQLQGVAYSDWRKLCFKAEPNQVCRTTISGTINTGQEVLRVDLIEGNTGSARILIVLPGGLYLPAGVKIAIDDGEALQIPYMWSFSNVCVAAKSVSSDLIGRMRSGRSMSIEAVDSGLLAVTATLPLNRFADANSAPTTLDQSLAK